MTTLVLITCAIYGVVTAVVTICEIVIKRFREKREREREQEREAALVAERMAEMLAKRHSARGGRIEMHDGGFSMELPRNEAEMAMEQFLIKRERSRRYDRR